MVNKVKNLSVPIKKVEFSDTSNPSLKKCSIYVMHTGENFNGSSFSRESVNKARESLKNIPILASIKRDEDYDPIDFEGHEIEARIIENSDGIDWKTIYIEKPIGVIPESNNYRIESLENDEKWVVVDGYIWSEYSNGAYDLLKASDKKVSMEIAVDGGFFDDEFMYHIEDYHYLGITVLGEDYPPAMGSNAVISLFNKDESSKGEYIKLLHEIQSLEEGGEKMPREKEEFEKEEIKDYCPDCGKNPCECEKKSEEAEETQEEFKADVCPDCGEEICECEKDEEDEFAKKKKSGSGGKKKRRCSKDEDEEKEDFEVKYNETLAELNELKAKYVDLQSNFESLNNEISELREFKISIEKQEKDTKLGEIFNEYSALNKFEEYKTLFEKRYDLEEDEIIKSLKVIAFDNGVNIKRQKKDFSKENNKIKIPLVDSIDIKTNSDWDILERHIKK